jgi:hypothetical protein
MWTTLLTNATSLRQEVYYGINQGGQGPAVRDVAGNKLILAERGGGGGKGEWSPQQLPNATQAAQTPPAFPQQCTIQQQTCYPAHDAETRRVAGVAECCAAAAQNHSVVGFTFRANPSPHPNCFLKSTLINPEHSGCTSGFRVGTHPVPPGPPPGPPPPPVLQGHLLYNVADDMGEHTPLDMHSSENAAIVQRLQAIVDRYALTKVPQATGDPNCPPFSGLNTTDPTGATKLYIGPWCD